MKKESPFPKQHMCLGGRATHHDRRQAQKDGRQEGDTKPLVPPSDHIHIQVQLRRSHQCSVSNPHFLTHTHKDGISSVMRTDKFLRGTITHHMQIFPHLSSTLHLATNTLLREHSFLHLDTHCDLSCFSHHEKARLIESQLKHVILWIHYYSLSSQCTCVSDRHCSLCSQLSVHTMCACNALSTLDTYMVCMHSLLTAYTLVVLRLRQHCCPPDSSTE